MKIKYLIYPLLAIAGAMTSCTEDAVDDLSGSLQAPEIIENPTLINDGVDEIGNLNCFNLIVKDGTNTLHLAMTGDRYYLDSDYFTLASSDNIQKNKILVFSTFVERGNEQVHPTAGSVSVTRNGDSYTLSGVLWLEDQSILKFDVSGQLLYERKATTLRNPVMAEITELSEGIYQFYLVIGGEGLTGSKQGQEILYNGTGDLFATYIIIDNINSLDGTYSPADAEYGDATNVYTPGTFLKGTTYMYDFFGYQIPLNVYTCWYKMVDGQQTEDVTQIKDGEISIITTGSDTYKITVDCGEIYAVYEGALDIIKPISEEDATYTYTDLQEAKDSGIQHTVTLYDNNGNSSAQFVFVSADANVAGTYTYADPAETPGQLSKGMELFGIPLGSYYTKSNTKYYLSGGTLQITDNNGSLSFRATNVTSASGTGEAGDKKELNFENVTKK